MYSQPVSRGKLALLPLLLFISLFLGAGFYFQLQGVDYAFYQLPAPVAIIPAIVLAIFLSRETLNQSIEQFVSGVGNNNIITMCLIYLVAGAFSSVAKASGGVDATVALGLSVVPEQLILPGLFVISAFIATAMGTSMGTLAAVGPVGLAIAQTTDMSGALVAGVLVSGAIFGDNLSIISDTTIAATRTQGCDMKDKFVENIKLALPSALIVLVILVLLGEQTVLPQSTESNVWLALPYLLILVLAVVGVNVFVVLGLGIVSSALLGATFGDYQITTVGKDVYTGFGQMQEVFLLSLLLGGLSELMRRQGGLDYLVSRISGWINRWSVNSKLGHSVGIAGLTSLANTCIANNTVAIIVSGETVKALAEKGQIAPKRAASLIDIFSCVVQGILPYGAQLLMLGAVFEIAPVEILPYVFYCYVLAVVSVSSFIWQIKATS